MKNRTELINYIIKKRGYQSYLEIGVQGGVNFSAVNVITKVGVDPAINSVATIKMTSDKYFAENNSKFDLIFIDGLHLKEQVWKDIKNALTHLNSGGIILLHDCSPTSKQAQRRIFINHKHWNGDVWKAVARLRMTDTHVRVSVVDLDEGIGIVEPGEQDLFVPKKIFLTYKFLENNRQRLLNIISVDDFLKII